MLGAKESLASPSEAGKLSLLEARAEQELLAVKLRDINAPEVDPHLLKFFSAPYKAPAGEAPALRAHLADLSSSLLEREAEAGALEEQHRRLVQDLARAGRDDKNALQWRSRYDKALSEQTAAKAAIKKLASEETRELQEIRMICQHVRKLQDEARITDRQRERLTRESARLAGTLPGLSRELRQATSDCRRMEDLVQRCVANITDSVAAGVITVLIDGGIEATRFSTLHVCDRQGELRIFEEPDDKEALHTFPLKPNVTAVDVDEKLLHITISDADGLQAQLALHEWNEFCKWIGGLNILGMLKEGDLGSFLGRRGALPKVPRVRALLPGGNDV